MKKRIWELDALRGICILGMVVVHLGYDLDSLGMVGRVPLLEFFLNWGGILFLLISGICVTLGKHPILRGLIVFCCGMICTAVTTGMYLLDFAEKSLIIYFGVLHCLGCCMLLWGLFSRCKPWLLAAVGVVFVAAGFCLDSGSTVTFPWLIPLGFTYPGFASSDYFPLLPNLGYFLLGAFLGRVLYRRRESLLPKVDPQRQPIRFLCRCGQLSLWIYLLHQPVITGILSLLALFNR